MAFSFYVRDKYKFNFSINYFNTALQLKCVENIQTNKGVCLDVIYWK